ncbi:hypothetical protein STEG23_022856 [Scotinomys teguina]
MLWGFHLKLSAVYFQEAVALQLSPPTPSVRQPQSWWRNREHATGPGKIKTAHSARGRKGFIDGVHLPPSDKVEFFTETCVCDSYKIWEKECGPSTQSFKQRHTPVVETWDSYPPLVVLMIWLVIHVLEEESREDQARTLCGRL